ncbi:hypothetical protein [Actinotalea sp. K2]|uniref:hypothetical protein n=1 Tax=Actinotalea sp. K2 TaxID=2939438 RepID=UPI00201813D8|nr:hypothetical protein [Actinotalea sp. K2]MCL3862737.1 hypothetical protein [Actinotalea sp. K2]
MASEHRDLSPAPRTARRIAALSSFLRALGVISTIWGVLYVANGATQARGWVKVPVALLGAPDSGGGWGNSRVVVPGVEVAGGWFAGARPVGAEGVAGPTGGTDGVLTLAAWDSTVLEQVLGRGDWLVAGLGLLVGGLTLRRVLLAIASGRPFAGGTSRHLLVAAGAIAVAGFLAPLLPQLAGLLVLDRVGLAGQGQFSTGLLYSVEPVLVAAVVAAVAVAFRAGEQMTREMDGLV